MKKGKYMIEGMVELDKPTKCCRARIVVMDYSIDRFICPCGGTKTHENEIDTDLGERTQK